MTLKNLPSDLNEKLAEFANECWIDLLETKLKIGDAELVLGADVKRLNVLRPLQGTAEAPQLTVTQSNLNEYKAAVNKDRENVKTIEVEIDALSEARVKLDNINGQYEDLTSMLEKNAADSRGQIILAERKATKKNCKAK